MGSLSPVSCYAKEIFRKILTERQPPIFVGAGIRQPSPSMSGDFEELCGQAAKKQHSLEEGGEGGGDEHTAQSIVTKTWHGGLVVHTPRATTRAPGSVRRRLEAVSDLLDSTRKVQSQVCLF